MGVTGSSNEKKVSLFGIGINPTTYQEATAAVIEAAQARRSFSVTALATHGLMHAVLDADFAGVLNRIDLVTPDGQPVRWAMNVLCDTGLRSRVYGPTLTTTVCAEAERLNLSVYLFGSTKETCDRLVEALARRFPSLKVAGVHYDRFREATPEEDREDVSKIIMSGAHVILVGRGCPRQERWVEQHRGQVPGAMLAVGAAFDYLAGVLQPPPVWMQDVGLEWLYRLCQEPRRLWRRYLFTNTYFLLYFFRAWSHKRWAQWRSRMAGRA